MQAQLGQTNQSTNVKEIEELKRALVANEQQKLQESDKVKTQISEMAVRLAELEK